jgi:elongation factor G
MSPNLASENIAPIAGAFDYTLNTQLQNRREYARIIGYIQPCDRPFLFQNQITDQKLPSAFIAACHQGFQDAINSGILSGYGVAGVQVILTKVGYHPVYSTPRSFRLAACQAFYQGMMNSTQIIMEPLMDVMIDMPTNLLEAVEADIISRRGTIVHREPNFDRIDLWAQVPLSELIRYDAYLRSLTNGQARCHMIFSEYQPVPLSLLEKNRLHPGAIRLPLDRVQLN